MALKSKKTVNKKNRSKNKTELPRIKIKDFLLVAAVLVIVSVLIYSGICLNHYFSSASFFTVRKIRSNVHLEYDLRPCNIFKADLGKIQKDITRRYPQFRKISVTRVFPNVIEVFVQEREPFFQIEKSGYFSVDKEGVVVSGPFSVPSDDIIVYPVFSGRQKFAPGEKLSIQHLDDIIKVLDKLKEYNTASRKITALKVSDLNNMSFIFDKIEVRIGKGGYKEKTEILFDRVIPQFEHDLDKIEYVDLRFNDYVIGYRK